MHLVDTDGRGVELIDEAGGEMAHLVKVVVYITDVRHREAVYRTMGEYIRGVHPVSTGLVVQALARPEWLVEIEAMAAPAAIWHLTDQAPQRLGIADAAGLDSSSVAASTSARPWSRRR